MALNCDCTGIDRQGNISLLTLCNAAGSTGDRHAPAGGISVPCGARDAADPPKTVLDVRLVSLVAGIRLHASAALLDAGDTSWN